MNFPNCTIYDMPQRSDAWYDIRKGIMTASQAGSWLADVPAVRMTIAEIREVLKLNGIKPTPKGTKPELVSDCLYAGLTLPFDVLESTKSARLTAASKLMAEIAGCAGPPDFEIDPTGPPPRNPSLWAIWNGIRREEEAVEHFIDATGIAVEDVGFCKSKAGAFGCSPDGLIPATTEGFEGKAPIPATHCKYLMAGVLPPEYKDQVHFSMAVTGAEAWWFQSYCPGLPTLRMRVERDDYTARMFAGAVAFSDYLADQQSTLCGLWDEQLGRRSE